MAVVQFADVGMDAQTDSAIAQDDGREVQLHAIGLKLNGDRSSAAAVLGNGIRELAARHEGGLLAAGGHEVGFRQRPEQTVLLQRIDEIRKGDGAEGAGAKYAGGIAEYAAGRRQQVGRARRDAD